MQSLAKDLGATLNATEGVKADDEIGFYVFCNGQVESGRFDGVDDLYCKYGFLLGNSWKIVQGIDTGISQIARKAAQNGDPTVTWNFPVDITFKSNGSTYGW